MQRKFLTYCILFFVPVLLGYAVMELLSTELPSAFKANRAYIDREKDNAEILILGSSQMQGAVNPEWLSSPALNLASGDQHHDTDFKLLESFQKKLPQLNTVVLEVSYSHFELPHNGKDFWKNSMFLKYYGVNCFERRTYFKDQLLYLSNPKLFSEKIVTHFIHNEDYEAYNAFGFNTNNFQGQFKDLGHDEAKIAAMPRFKINTEPDPAIFETNSTLFEEMLNFLEEKHLDVVICKLPMYKTYHVRKNPDILRRRDSVLENSLLRYPNIRILDLETDTLNYQVNDYWNQSHLNPNGTRKFTAQLQDFLNTTK